MINKHYLAGFIDGEGCIGIYKHKDNRTEKGYTLHSVVIISNTNKSLLEEINRITNGELRKRQKLRGNKQIYVIHLQDIQGILNLMKLINPYLLIKKEQSKLMIEFCKSRIKNKNRKYTDREYEIAEIFTIINKRGEV